MINKIIIKTLIRLDRLIERFQDFLQNARLRIFEVTWDMIEKGARNKVKTF